MQIISTIGQIMTLKFFFTSFLLLCCINFSYSQTKNEKEERINASEFPALAQNVIALLPQNCKRLKFYQETDGDKQSFEAKFKCNKKHFSLEFSKLGEIEDIELLVKFRRLDLQTKTQLKSYFKQSYKKYRLIKIQKQYVYNAETTPLQFLNSIFTNNSIVEPNFEIIAEVTGNQDRLIMEFTFNNKGSVLNKRVLSPMSYEHVLY